MLLAWTGMALAALWLAFGYGGYALVLRLLARRRPRARPQPDDRAVRPAAPSQISVVIAVHDGAHELERKLKDTLALDGPASREVIVASDGSTDGSDEIARGFAEQGVRLVRNPQRQGKEAAQALAIREARGDVLVFTDVGAELAPNALRELVAPFADPQVGCVSSEDRVESDGGEGLYVRYEMALRRLESQVTGLIGLSGSLFAARRELCDPWPADLASDFRLALECGRRGLRAVSAPAAQVAIRTTARPGQEWSRKVRTVRRGLAVLAANRDLLAPRWGRLALALWGHKVARFTSPFALLLLFGASAAAAPESPLAGLLLVLQVGAWSLAAIALAWPPLAAWRLPRLAAFFALVNASTLVAWAYHLSGRRAVAWSPTRRDAARR